MVEDIQKKKLPHAGTLEGMMSVKYVCLKLFCSFSSLQLRKLKHFSLNLISPSPLFFDWDCLYLPVLALKPSDSELVSPLSKLIDNIHIPNIWLLTWINFAKVDTFFN